ncbi:MAG: KH domain-containing protein [Thermoanaerobaculia bacterium]
MPLEKTAEGAPMKRLIEMIVRRLSDRPEETRVAESFEGRTAVYEISVPEEDRGRLIGREGRTVRALRAFAGAAAAARGKRVIVRVRD